MLIALKKQGLSFTCIAKAIGCHRSTIYREFKRNTCGIWMALIVQVRLNEGQELGEDVQDETNILRKKITLLYGNFCVNNGVLSKLQAI